MGFAYLFQAPTVFVKGIIDILCRGVSCLLLLGFRLHSVWDLPIFLGLRLFLLRKVHDVCGGLLIFCVVVYCIS